jgi:antibiotic biosynthesis monooxygenase (ABM) superfamily enzyme
MENGRVIGLTGFWLSPDIEEKYLMWNLEVYAPLLIKIPVLLGTDRYRIVKPRPEYPGFIVINHFKSLKDRAEYTESPEWNATDQDRQTTFGDSYRFFWATTWELLRFVDKNERTAEISTPPVIHLEGFNLAKEQADRYNRWFNKWGYSTYLPILMKNAGLTGFAHYRFAEIERRETRLPGPKGVAYPEYLSIFKFDNLQAFDAFENSQELAAFRGAVEAGYANSLTPKWYVQYQLMKSLSK